MNTKAYTLNGAVYTFDVETGALLSLEMDGVKPMMAEGKGLFDLAWPVHLEYDIQRANPTANYGKCAPRFEYEEGTLTITDMETAEEVRVTMSSQTIKAYHRTLEEHNRQIERLAKKYGCAYMQISSDDDIEKVVFDTFKQKGIFG